MIAQAANVDFIGDVHGHASILRALLKKLGYEQQNGAFQHPERKVVFLGDYIDRGPDSPGVVRLVRSMVDAGAAWALCGNHEFNAVCFNQQLPNGTYLRPHTPKNVHQHQATLDQYHGNMDQYRSDVNWFKSLPLYWDHPRVRAVHATWDEGAIRTLTEHTQKGVVPYHELAELETSNPALLEAIEVSCKGVELALPGDHHFFDKDGHRRQEIRVKWWKDPAQARNFQEISVIPDLGLEHLAYNSDRINFYAVDAPPVFFGHYWMTGTPRLMEKNSCCLDFSVAKNGVLTAYRFDGESQLSADKLVWV